MKLALLQGMWQEEETSSLQGFSRVTPREDTAINGFSRVNHFNTDPKALQGLMLSGLMLSGKQPTMEAREDFECFLDMCEDYGVKPSAQAFGRYMMQGKAERQARRARRRARRQKKQDMRDRRFEAGTQKRERRAGEPGLLAQAGEFARDIFGGGGSFGENVGAFMTDYGALAESILPGSTDLASMIPGAGVGAGTKAGEMIDPEDGKSYPKGYLLGQVPFEPWKGRWWSSKRVPTWQKGAVAVGGAVGVDQLLLKGKFTNPILGINKGKARK